MLLAPNSFNSLQKDLFPTNAKKNSAPTIIAPGVAEGGAAMLRMGNREITKTMHLYFFQFLMPLADGVYLFKTMKT